VRDDTGTFVFANAVVSGSDACNNAFQETCTMVCATGYYGGSLTVDCSIDADLDSGLGVSWISATGNDLVCTEYDCGATVAGATAAQYSHSCSTTTYGETCDVSCAAGYTGTATTFTCGEGVWGGTLPSCAKRTCDSTPSTVRDDAGTFVFANAIVSGSAACNNAFQETCTMVCETGYYGGSLTVDCAVDEDLDGGLGVSWISSTGDDLVCIEHDCGGTIAAADTAKYDYNCGGTTYGDDCEVECGPGFEGTSANYTCAEGTWEGSLPTCSKRACDATPITVRNSGGTFDLANVVVSGGGSCLNKYQDSCTMACDEGYRGGSLTVNCELDSGIDSGYGVSWSSSASEDLVCTMYDCGSTISVADGLEFSYNCSSTTWSSACEVSCGAGFEGSPSTFTCGQGNWQGSLPTCTRKTCAGDPITIRTEDSTFDLANVVVSGGGSCSNAYQDTCNMQCAEGYSGGSLVIACETEGDGSGDVSWKSSTGQELVCTQLDCGALITGADDSKHSYDCGVVGTDTVYGQTCEMSCAAGYTGSPETFTCGESGGVGQWQGVIADCSKRSCDAVPSGARISTGSFSFVDAVVSGAAECTNKLYLDSCTMACATGYSGGSLKLDCELDPDIDSGNGVSWSSSTDAELTCEIYDCGPSPPGIEAAKHMYDCGSDTTYGNTCEVSCKPGYTGTASTFTCGENNNWLGSIPECSRRTCEEVPSTARMLDTTFDFSNAGISGGSCSNLYEASCPMTCNEGYSGGTLNLNCLLDEGIDSGNGVSWSSATGNALVCVEYDCGQVIVGGGLDSQYHQYNCSETTYGEECVVSCRAGYTGDEGTYTCGGGDLGGEWDGAAPVCTAVDCGPIDSLLMVNTDQNGCNDRQTFGSPPCEISCASGYEQDKANVVCGADGNWTGAGLDLLCIPFDPYNSSNVEITNEGDENEEVEAVVWTTIAVLALCFLGCLFGIYYIFSDPDGDKRGIGKKGLTEKQKRQVLLLPEFQELIAFYQQNQRETQMNLFADNDPDLEATKHVKPEALNVASHETPY